jgi:hypothetical protein
MAKAKPSKEQELAKITFPGGETVGEPGDIAVRNSWLINPKDVTEVRDEGDVVTLITTKGNFHLTQEEAEPFRPEESETEKPPKLAY